MNPLGLYLGHLGSTPVYADGSFPFLFIFAFMISGGQWYLFGIIVLVLILAILLHELAHALVAQWRGQQNVAVTLSGFGGYCTYTGQPDHRDKLMISLAGPAMNLLLAGVCWAVLTFGLPELMPVAGEPPRWLEITNDIVFMALLWNLFLGIFNLLPAYPLDGGQALRAGTNLVTGHGSTANKVTLVATFVSLPLAIAGFYLLFNDLPIFLIIISVFLMVTAYRELAS